MLLEISIMITYLRWFKWCYIYFEWPPFEGIWYENAKVLDNASALLFTEYNVSKWYFKWWRCINGRKRDLIEEMLEKPCIVSVLGYRRVLRGSVAIVAQPNCRGVTTSLVKSFLSIPYLSFGNAWIMGLELFEKRAFVWRLLDWVYLDFLRGNTWFSCIKFTSSSSLESI